MRLKATLIELFKRAVFYDKRLKIYNNGESNDYPERIERLINNSVTAKQAANTMAVFLAGQGFGDSNKFKVSKKTTLLQFLHRFANSLTRHRGAFIHVNYNLNYQFTSLSVLPFSQCRIGKKDDDDYNGKIAICKDWSDTKKNKIEWIDVYNPKKSVIDSQFKEGKGKYKGQVLYVNLDYNSEYPYSTIDAVQNDCDSEAQASLYKNRSLRKGFFGKTLVVTRPLVGAKPEDGSDEALFAEYHEQQSEREDFKKTIKQFIGAENADGVLHLELDYDDAEDLDKAILFKNIDANIDDKLFAFTETSVSNNIRFAFNNIPSLLVRESGGNIFSSSGEAIREAKLFYQEQTTMERMALLEMITLLMSNFKDFNSELIYEPLIKRDINN